MTPVRKSASKKTKRPDSSVCGFLLHVTHYDPVWVKRKKQEQPFDAAVACDVVDAMADVGMNLLVIDCADGVSYRSHPELKRHYTVPMAELRKVVKRAQGHNIEIVPKLNFAQSENHQHNHWFRPHNGLFDRPGYWENAFEIVDELVKEMQPERFFHIGMDEDHWRSVPQYVKAIKTLRTGLRKRKLRPVIWNDSACLWPEADNFLQKSLAAEDAITKDVVQVLWDYSGAKPSIIQRIVDKGFALWGAPGDGKTVPAMARAIAQAGGDGMLLTRWIPCVKKNRKALLDRVRNDGPLCMID